MRLELGECGFDGVEIRTVGRQIAQFHLSGSKQRFDCLNLVRSQIVQDQYVAGMQAGQQHLLEIHQENPGIDRPVHQKRSDDLIVTQSGQKRRTLPVTVGNRAEAALAPGTAAIKTGQFGVQARFIDKHQTAHVPVGLPPPPENSGRFNVGSVLLGGARRFFYNSTLNGAADATAP